MKTIIKSLFVVVAVAAVAGGATYAYFSDTKTSTANTFAAGTVSIDLGGVFSTGTAYFNVGNMAPGDSVSQCIVVHNTGNLPLLFEGLVQATTDENVNSVHFSDQLQVAMTFNPTDCATDKNPRFNNVAQNYPSYSGPLSGIFTPTASNGMDNVSGGVNAFNNDGQVFHPGEYAVYKAVVTLPTTTTNDWQGKKFIGDVIFKAVQKDNQTQGSVLWN